MCPLGLPSAALPTAPIRTIAPQVCLLLLAGYGKNKRSANCPALYFA